jgi:RHS repeat-associated protein
VGVYQQLEIIITLKSCGVMSQTKLFRNRPLHQLGSARKRDARYSSHRGPYDATSRVTRILHDSPTTIIDDLLYTYDAAGNRISFTRANGSATLLPESVQAAYDAANEQIQFNSTTPNLTYDANGNLTSHTDASGTTTYTWDARNRLIALSGPGVSASFVYDALGRRVSKTINGVTTSYLYDGNDIIQEIGGSAVTATYLRSLNIDEPFVRQSGSNEYFHTDALGSTIALSSSIGIVTVSHSYEPFGRTTVTGSSSNPFQYTGRENDDRLYYYRARYYSWYLHRFLSEDPLGLDAGDINLYTYVFGNPVSYSDPSGKLLPLLAFALIGTGGLVNGIVDGTSAAALGTQDPFAAFGKGFVSGAVGTATGLAVAALTKNPALIGSTAGLASNLTSQLLDNGFRFDELSARKAVLSTVLGAGGGFLPQVVRKIPGLQTRGRLPDPWKPRSLSEFGPNSWRLLINAAVTGVVGGTVGNFVSQ